MSYSIPYSFIPGTKARAQELNENFSSVVQAIDNFDAQKADIDLSNLSASGIDVLKDNSVTRNIGEVVMSAFPLNDAGLHLLDGSLLDGSGIYSEFIDYINDLYENNNTFNISVFNVTGALSITEDGIASGFGSSNDITTVYNFKPTGTWVIEGSFTTPTNLASCTICAVSSTNHTTRIHIRANSSNYYLGWSLSANNTSYFSTLTGSVVLTPETKYYFEWSFSGEKYLLKVSTDGENWQTSAEFISSDSIYAATNSTIRLGKVNTNNEIFTGSIDLKDFMIKENGITVFSGTKSSNFFTNETTWQDTVSAYGECAKFVYDKTNNTVRLPKISGLIEGTSNSLAVGDLTEAGLPDISGYLTYMNSNPEIQSGGAFSHEYINGFNMTGGSGNHLIETIRFNASSSNGIYGSSTTVQPQTVKYLVYIVVATTPKTDIQVNLDNIASDLNNKADADLTNCTRPYITETYKNGASWYRVYSDGWCEQGGIVSVVQTSSGTTVTLLKSYIDTNYSKHVTLNDFAATWSAELAPRIVANSTSQITIQSGATKSPSLMCWYTCGKIR